MARAGHIAWVLMLVVLAVFALLWQLRPPVLPDEPGRAYKKDARLANALSGMRPNLDDAGYLLSWDNFGHVSDPFDVRTAIPAWKHAGFKGAKKLEVKLAEAVTDDERYSTMLDIGRCLAYEGSFADALAWYGKARSLAQAPQSPLHARLHEAVWLQGITSLRQGTTDNCVVKHVETSCILPIDPAAIYRRREGPERAIAYFAEYLELKPGSPGARWLSSIAAMTLGKFPDGLTADQRVPPETFRSSSDIGKFRDIATKLGVDRKAVSGGGIMDDFDNDGLLDITASCFFPDEPMVYYKNRGDGTFENRSKQSGLDRQLGGFKLCQVDYDNDGWLDIFVSRIAFGGYVHQSLLRNNHDGTFTDVMREARITYPLNSIFAVWADYDNDGWADVFIGCHDPDNRSRLYRNKGNGTFEEVATTAGVHNGSSICKGASWGDYDRDGDPDLYVSNFGNPPRLYRNDGNGRFTDVARQMGITKPMMGFSTWFFDYDNDGWLDIFASAFDGEVDEAVRDILGQPNSLERVKVHRNIQGQRFDDVTEEIGLSKSPVIMGSNFMDVDNDGYLDVYLGTGAPNYSMLFPNRMYRNVEGKRFEDITFSSGTGHVQKGHGVSAGDWDRDGNVDIFVVLGGAVPADPFYSVLFQNPGHVNHWITVKLAGVKTNKAALGATITVRAGGKQFHRQVDSGSSFGANPLQQTIGIGDATAIDAIEVNWPTSRTTQTFKDVKPNQAIRITEFAKDYERLNWTRVPAPN